MSGMVTSLQDRAHAGNQRIIVWNVTGPTSYTTLGEPLTAAQLGLQKITSIACDLGASSTPACRAVKYDYTNSKLQYFDQAFAEIASGVDLSSFSGRLTVLGY
jgi:hypothetical protein